MRRKASRIGKGAAVGATDTKRSSECEGDGGLIGGSDIVREGRQTSV